MPDVQKFDRARIAAISSTPWSIHETANPDGVFVEKSVKDDPGIENVVKARKMYIHQVEIDAFGYTPGCRKCLSIFGRGKGDTSLRRTPRYVAQSSWPNRPRWMKDLHVLPA